MRGVMFVILCAFVVSCAPLETTPIGQAGSIFESQNSYCDGDVRMRLGEVPTVSTENYQKSLDPGGALNYLEEVVILDSKNHYDKRGVSVKVSAIRERAITLNINGELVQINIGRVEKIHNIVQPNGYYEDEYLIIQILRVDIKKRIAHTLIVHKNMAYTVEPCPGGCQQGECL